MTTLLVWIYVSHPRESLGQVPPDSILGKLEMVSPPHQEPIKFPALHWIIIPTSYLISFNHMCHQTDPRKFKVFSSVSKEGSLYLGQVLFGVMVVCPQRAGTDIQQIWSYQ